MVTKRIIDVDTADRADGWSPVWSDADGTHVYGAPLSNPMDAVGDIIVGTTGGAADKLAIGAAGGALSVINGALAYNSGTSFPASKLAGDRYWRTDLGMEFYWDGTRWLSTTVYADAMPAHSALSPVAGTTSGVLRIAAPPLRGGSDIYLLTLSTAFYVSGGTALGASHKWVGSLVKTHGTTTTNIVATINVDSGASDTWRTSSADINALLHGGTAETIVSVSWVKTGTPGNIYVVHSLTYRVVAT